MIYIASVTPILQHDPVSRIRYVSAYPYPILRYTFVPLSFAEIWRIHVSVSGRYWYAYPYRCYIGWRCYFNRLCGCSWRQWRWRGVKNLEENDRGVFEKMLLPTTEGSGRCCYLLLCAFRFSHVIYFFPALKTILCSAMYIVCSQECGNLGRPVCGPFRLSLNQLRLGVFWRWLFPSISSLWKCECLYFCCC